MGVNVGRYKKSDESRIETFEMKGLRQIVRVSWTAKTVNGFWKKLE